MKFYDISFMDVGSELRLTTHSREGSTWIAVNTNAADLKGFVVLHIREGHEDRLRVACEAFNTALSAPIAIAAE